ncbi:MAG TPA: M15 family metallopeptidase [Pyrinomonadaceae bacterium]|nr:M15 family metallopeptidase [Pyrinomonadaceae bacterium]
MNFRKIFYKLVFAIFFGSVAFYTGNFARTVYGQTTPERKTLVTRTVSTNAVDSGNSKTEFATVFVKAASENARLQNSLAWDFGGRTQTGWNIYSALIEQTIGTDGEPDSPAFAQALSAWQGKSGIEPTGILDAATLKALTAKWQSQRLGHSEYPPADKLLTAPISDFYDSTRDVGLLQVEKETYAAYKRMVAAAAKDLGKNLKLTANGDPAPDEKFFRIVSAFRSREYQEQLRRQQPQSGRTGLAKFSAHATGQALDLYIGGEPVTTKDANRLIQVQTPEYKWLVKNAAKFGFYPYFYEPWHWEYVPKNNSELGVPRSELKSTN